MADTGAGKERELRWWELEGLPVPPAWTSAHPGHPDYVAPPKRRRARRSGPQIRPEDFGLPPYNR